MSKINKSKSIYNSKLSKFIANHKPIIGLSLILIFIAVFYNILVVTPEIDAVTTGDAGGGGGVKTAVKCTRKETKCGKLCVNTYSDNKNCGKCGKRCGVGYECDSGRCINLTQQKQEACKAKGTNYIWSNGVCSLTSAGACAKFGSDYKWDGKSCNLTVCNAMKINECLTYDQECKVVSGKAECKNLPLELVHFPLNDTKCDCYIDSKSPYGSFLRCKVWRNGLIKYNDSWPCHSCNSSSKTCDGKQYPN